MDSIRHFYSCDWGTSRFRLRLVERSGCRVLDEIVSDAGVRSLHESMGPGATVADREAVFARYLAHQWRRLVARAGEGVREDRDWILVSGMASSTVGWRELPYAGTPYPLDGSRAELAEVSMGMVPGAERVSVRLVSGVRTATDIMRGEETEILGLLGAGGEDFAAAERVILVLPGTHSKHVWVEGGAMVDFRTYLTGEWCETLARHSLLRVSVHWPPEGTLADSGAGSAFVEGVDWVRRHGLGRALFRTRTRTVLDGVPPRENGWFLAGLAIGAEAVDLAGEGGDRPIWIAGGSRFAGLYDRALRTVGAAGRVRVLPAAWVEGATVRAHARLLERRQAP